jgi:hypothetical protein
VWIERLDPFSECGACAKKYCSACADDSPGCGRCAAFFFATLLLLLWRFGVVHDLRVRRLRRMRARSHVPQMPSLFLRAWGGLR